MLFGLRTACRNGCMFCRELHGGARHRWSRPSGSCRPTAGCRRPAGFRVAEDGVLHRDRLVARSIFNPSFPYRFAHMVAAAYLDHRLYRRRHRRLVHPARAERGPRPHHARHGRRACIVWLAPLQLVIGDLHGLNTREHQPAKIAAIEGHWETERGAPAHPVRVSRSRPPRRTISRWRFPVSAVSS